VKRIVWTEQAKADVRSLDRVTAMRILATLHRFAESGEGDAKALTSRDELRLRIGDYKLFLLAPVADTIQIMRVLHRREAYR
jgi:mRNA-degrading endonuclease RelE of RelBE toxin-antitoxin system